MTEYSLGVPFSWETISLGSDPLEYDLFGVWFPKNLLPSGCDPFVGGVTRNLGTGKPRLLVQTSALDANWSEFLPWHNPPDV